MAEYKVVFKERWAELAKEMIPAALEKARAEAEAKGKKLTKAQARQVEYEADSEARRRANSEARDPGGDLYDDPVWNSKHPMYNAVNNLIDAGFLPDDAVAKVRHDAANGIDPLPGNAATQKQVDFFRTLLEEREATFKSEVVVLEDRVLIDGKPATKKQVSDGIGYLKEQPRKVAPHPAENKPVREGLDLSQVPSATYAVPGGDTRLKVRIEQGTKRWEGWTFVKDGAEYGAGKRYGIQKPGEAYRGDIEDALRAIAADPKAALEAYGKLVGRCGVCSRKLEDEESVARGIGPVCAANLGF